MQKEQTSSDLRWHEVTAGDLPENCEQCHFYDDGTYLRVTSVLAMDESGAMAVVNRMLLRKTGIEYLDSNPADAPRDEWFWSKSRGLNGKPVWWMPIPPAPRR